MIMLKKGTWVLIADSEKALLLENQTDVENPHLTVVSKNAQAPADRSSDRPGRMRDGGPGQKSAFEETDWHELAKDRFANDLSELLHHHAHRGDFREVVLVASPSVLGALRGQLHADVAQKVVGEIPKTLTRHPLTKIQSIVKEELAG